MNSDRVVIGLTIPSESVLKSYWLEQHIIYGVPIDVVTMTMYGTTGHLLPYLDPDTPLSFETMWDTQVPKDSDLASGVFEHDTAPGAPDSTPEWEPGQPSPAGIMGMSTAPTEVMRRRKRISFANTKNWADVATDVFMPSDFYVAQSNRSRRVEMDSALLFGTSNPELVDTTATEPTTLSLQNLSFIKYVDMTLRMAFMELLGLTEAGAETPWTEAAAAIQLYTETSLFEETAGAFAPQVLNAFTFATIGIEVVGDVDKMVITSEG